MHRLSLWAMRGLALIFGLMGSPALAADASTTAAPAVKAPTVSVVTSTAREIVATSIVSGTLVAREEVMVAPEVEGLAIVELLAEEGDKVAAGQVLARLSRSALDVQLGQNTAALARNEAAIAQARAAIADAEANRVQTANAFTRTKTLRTSGFSSDQQFDLSNAAARSAEAKVQSAKEGLAVALAEKTSTEASRKDIDLKLSRTEIKAPKAGIISRRTARVGAGASMTMDPLFRIIAEGAVELEAEIAEVELYRMKAGQPVQVTPAGADKPVAGEIRLVSPEVDKAARLGKIRIKLAESAGLAVGSFARGVVETGRRTGVTVPVQALTYRRSGPIVQVVKDNRIISQPVTTGLVGDGFAEIVSGLEANQMVVARAGTFLRDGDIITPVPLKAE
jgi:HlyD family secretion protein